jgi:hypothetical protein
LLDAKTLESTIRLENATEKQNRIEAFQLQALKSLHAAVDKKQTNLVKLTSLEVESLAKSPFVSVSVEAKSLLEAFNTAGKN